MSHVRAAFPACRKPIVSGGKWEVSFSVPSVLLLASYFIVMRVGLASKLVSKLTCLIVYQRSQWVAVVKRWLPEAESCNPPGRPLSVFIVQHHCDTTRPYLGSSSGRAKPTLLTTSSEHLGSQHLSIYELRVPSRVEKLLVLPTPADVLNNLGSGFHYRYIKISLPCDGLSRST